MRALHNTRKDEMVSNVRDIFGSLHKSIMNFSDEFYVSYVV